MSGVGDRARRLVRALGRPPADVQLFCGWDDSVLWAPDPLPYDGLDLPDGLRSDLDRWNLRWSRTAHPDAVRGPSRQERRRHDREGRRLAQQVAESFGDELVVELQLSRRLLSRRRFRGRGAPVAPAARTAVRARQAEAAADRLRMEELLADGAVPEWRSEPPEGARPEDRPREHPGPE